MLFRGLKTEKDLDRIKRTLIKNGVFGRFPGNSEVLALYKKLVAEGKEARSSAVELMLRKIKTKSNSGVVSVSLLTKPYPCPGKCLYCPSDPLMPKSYLKKEPAAARALRNKFNPYDQVICRLQALSANGHPVDKVEIIIIGGTWSCYPFSYQKKFISEIFRACNNFGVKKEIKKGQKTFLELQRLNEKAKSRIVGISIETRPEFIDVMEIRKLRELGVTKVEIGVQHLEQKILDLNRRGVTIEQIINATDILRRNGLKIVYHMMLNLYGSTPKSDIRMFEKLFSDLRFQPDMLKIYPLVILKSAGLYKIWKEGKIKPYSDSQLREILIKIKKKIPPYVRIIRVIRDIPKEYIVSGSKISNMRQELLNDQKKNKWKCRCIRCREIREEALDFKKLKMKKIIYPVLSGREVFLSWEDAKRDKLAAFSRLFLPNNFDKTKTLSVLENCALVRELHTYGRLAPIFKKGSPLRRSFSEASQSQHLGLGKSLLKEAERIAIKNGFKKIVVIAGIGARKYYKKFGYRLKESYMTKSLIFV